MESVAAFSALVIPLVLAGTLDVVVPCDVVVPSSRRRRLLHRVDLGKGTLRDHVIEGAAPVTSLRALLDGGRIENLHIQVVVEPMVVEGPGFREMQAEAAVVHEHSLPPVLPVELLDVLAVFHEPWVQPVVGLDEKSLEVVPRRQPCPEAIDDSSWFLGTE